MNLSAEPAFVFYGGSFDPPHSGHVDCVEQVCARLPQATVMVSVSPRPAGASGKHKAPIASFQDRMEMCRRAFAATSERVIVSDFEAKLSGTNLTVETLKALRAERDDSIGLLIGQDQLESFHRWHEPKAILEIANLVVVARSGFDRSLLDVAATLTETLKLQTEPVSTDILRLTALGTQMILIQADICAAESTTIRQKLASSEAVQADWVPTKVLEYAREYSIYQA